VKKATPALSQNSSRSKAPHRSAASLETLKKDLDRVLVALTSSAFRAASCFDDLVRFFDRPGVIQDLESHLRTHHLGVKALHTSAEFGEPVHCEVLIKAGVPIDARDSDEHTALSRAMYSGNFPAAKWLLDAGANARIRFGPSSASLLHYAARGGDTLCVDLCLSMGHSIVVHDTAGAVPLHFAADNNASDIFAMLANEQTINARASDGLTPLLQLIDQAPASLESDPQVSDSFDEMIRLGAAIEPPHGSDWLGRSALHYAAKSMNPELCRRLIKLGADVNAPDVLGRTPLMGYVEFCSELPALSRKNSPLLAKMLLDAGADPDRPNHAGATARQLAKEAKLHNVLAAIQAMDAMNVVTRVVEHSKPGQRVDPRRGF
jgi:ankyrin repeat protein